MQEENIVESLEDRDTSTQIFVTAKDLNQTVSGESSQINNTVSKANTSNDEESANKIPDQENSQTLSQPTTSGSQTENLSAQIDNSDTDDENHTPKNQQRSLDSDIYENTETMTLSLSDILNGIPDFSSKNHDEIKNFIAKADMIHTLATGQTETVLTVIRAKLVTANKLGDISASSWPQIKTSIQTKYRTTVSFEVAQERLLAIKQGPKESLDDYSNRAKQLLEALNSTTTDENAAIQSSNRVMNESLAIRKFEQNIFDEKIRLLALSSEHTSLPDAIAHACEKREQINSSNVTKEMVKTESNADPKQSKAQKKYPDKKNNDQKEYLFIAKSPTTRPMRVFSKIKRSSIQEIKNTMDLLKKLTPNQNHSRATKMHVRIALLHLTLKICREMRATYIQARRKLKVNRCRTKNEFQEVLSRTERIRREKADTSGIFGLSYEIKIDVDQFQFFRSEVNI